jgi:hypothetical protein
MDKGLLILTTASSLLVSASLLMLDNVGDVAATDPARLFRSPAILRKPLFKGEFFFLSV